MLLYAGQFVSRWSIQRTISPWDLAALRFAAAGLLLLPVVLRHGFGGAAGVGWGRALLLTLAAGGPYTLIMFAGPSFAPAGHGAVIIPGATPVVSTALVWLWFGERPWPTRLAGLALVVVGLVLVGWPGITGATGEQR
jgi:drug/metabolite transporter (DMT)-like permease